MEDTEEERGDEVTTWTSLPVGSLWIWTGAQDVEDPDYLWYFRFPHRRLEGPELPGLHLDE